MPSVELRRRRQFAAPSDTGARGTSAAQGLAKALGLVEDVVTGEGMRVFKIQEERAITAERERVDDLLASPTITAEEAAEVAASTKYLENQTRALNRQGEVRAEKEYDRIAEEVGKAPDVLTARQRLRELQAEVSEGLPPGVAAGVAERFAQYAPNLLQQASARRQGRQEVEEAVNIGTDFRSSLESRGATGMLESFRGALSDEILTRGGDGSRVHDIAIDTLENRWLAGEELGTDTNLFADDTLATLDSLLGDQSTGEAAQRSKYLKLRERIISAEERKRTSEGSILNAQRKADHTSWTRIASGYRRRGEPVPDEILDQMQETASTGAEVRAAEEFANNFDSPGMSGTSEARNARSNMNNRFRKDELGNLRNPEQFAEANEFFDRAVRSMNPIEDEADRQRVMNELAREAEKIAREEGDRRDNVKAAFDAQQKNKEARLIQAFTAGAIDESVFGELLDETWLEFEQRNFNDRLNDVASRVGVNVSTLIRPTRR
jgi:hypothetical protein